MMYDNQLIRHLHPHLGVLLKNGRRDSVQARDVERRQRACNCATAHQRLPAKKVSDSDWHSPAALS